MLDLQNKVKWEWLSTEVAEGFTITASRLKVPDGWLVSKMFYEGITTNGNRSSSIALTFVPDESHLWESIYINK